MHVRLIRWLGREFVSLAAEGGDGTPEQQTRILLERFDAELRGHGLSLENTVRTRLWARDREARTRGTAERLVVLSGRARSASSSFIATDRFATPADVALDLLALRPAMGQAVKSAVEYEPPVAPVRYIIYESLAFLSGVTASGGALGEQTADILGRIGESLAMARTSWGRAALVSCFLHRDHRFEELKDLLPPAITEGVPRVEYVQVDGYAGEGRLLEIEVTATL